MPAVMRGMAYRIQECFPVTFSWAQKSRKPFYFTGKPCKHGHRAARITASGSCIVCANARSLRAYREGRRGSKESRQRALKRWNNSSGGHAAKMRWRLRDPERAWIVMALAAARGRARAYGVPFALSREFLKSIMTERCPALGIPLIYGNRGIMAPNSASLDRIIPANGYVEGNVIILSRKANTIKSNATASEVRRVAEWLESVS